MPDHGEHGHDEHRDGVADGHKTGHQVAPPSRDHHRCGPAAANISRPGPFPTTVILVCGAGKHRLERCAVVATAKNRLALADAATGANDDRRRRCTATVPDGQPLRPLRSPARRHYAFRCPNDGERRTSPNGSRHRSWSRRRRRTRNKSRPRIPAKGRSVIVGHEHVISKRRGIFVTVEDDGVVESSDEIVPTGNAGSHRYPSLSVMRRQ